MGEEEGEEEEEGCRGASPRQQAPTPGVGPTCCNSRLLQRLRPRPWL